MKCPHCATAVEVNWQSSPAVPLYWEDDSIIGANVQVGTCPSCDKFIDMYQLGSLISANPLGHGFDQIQKREVIYPKGVTRPLEPEVPHPYKSEFQEACAISNISPKASAALSRRILQNVLREEFGIKHGSLAQEIEDFIELADTPSHLSKAVDAIRNVGNFAAHPLKDTNTGAIVDVEPGEAEWLLDVLEALFDFTFVQPKRLEERKRKLNEKLEKIGKPPMKE